MAEQSSNPFHGMNARRKRGEWCDFEIRVQGQIFKVHRLVLDSRSEYFHTMFDSNLQEPKEGYCELKNEDANVVETCVEFMYTGKMDITAGMAVKVLKLSHMWILNDAVSICENLLQETLNEACCLSYRKVARLYDLKRLLSDCNEFISNNISKITESDEIVTLEFSELRSILQEQLKCDPKDSWKMCTWWSSLHDQFCDMIQCFPFEEFPLQEFLDIVLEESHIKNCEQCKKIAVTSCFSSVNISEEITVDNCLHLQFLANHYKCTDVQKDLKEFVMYNHVKVFQRSEFKDVVSPSDLFNYIRCLKNVKSTKEELQAIVSWVKFNKIHREGYFGQLFREEIELSNTFLSEMMHHVWFLSFRDILYIKELSRRHSCQRLQKKLDECIIENFSEIIKVFEAVKLKSEDLMLYLQNSKSYSKDPTEIWKFLLRWVDHDCEKRQLEFPQVFKKLQLNIFPTEFLKENISTCIMVESNRICTQYLMQFLFQQMTIMELQLKRQQAGPSKVNNLSQKTIQPEVQVHSVPVAKIWKAKDRKPVPVSMAMLKQKQEHTTKSIATNPKNMKELLESLKLNKK